MKATVILLGIVSALAAIVCIAATYLAIWVPGDDAIRWGGTALSSFTLALFSGAGAGMMSIELGMRSVRR